MMVFVAGSLVEFYVYGQLSSLEATDIFHANILLHTLFTSWFALTWIERQDEGCHSPLQHLMPARSYSWWLFALAFPILFIAHLSLIFSIGIIVGLNFFYLRWE